MIYSVLNEKRFFLIGQNGFHLALPRSKCRHVMPRHVAKAILSGPHRRLCDDSATMASIPVVASPHQPFGDVSRHNLTLMQDVWHSGADAALALASVSQVIALLFLPPVQWFWLAAKAA